MSNISKFTGLEMDQAFAKALSLTYTENGFIKLQSSEAKPIDLDDITQPGNYHVSHWIHGPEFPEEFKGPINVYVYTIEEISYQMIRFLTDVYIRSFAAGEFTGWGMKQAETAVSSGITPPSNPGKNTIWLDTSSNPPVLKIFDGADWNVIVPADMMRRSVYDPLNKSKDIYVVIDETIASKNIDYSAHIADDTIHVTQDEKTAWTNKATQEDVENAAESMRNDLMENVVQQAGTFADSSQTLTETVTEYKEIVTNHVGDTTAHPTEEMIANWNSKADGDHTHILDGKVKVSADDIVGTIPVNLIDKSALERTYLVDTEAERLALTIAEVQEGDMVYVRNTYAYYFVIDDTKLDSEDGYLPFSIGNAVFTWENIENKPTTLAGFGIIDAYTKEEVERKMTALDSDITYIKNSYAEYETIDNIDVTQLTQIQEGLSNVDYTALRDRTETLLTEVADFNNALERLRLAVATYTSLI